MGVQFVVEIPQGGHCCGRRLGCRALPNACLRLLRRLIHLIGRKTQCVDDSQHPLLEQVGRAGGHSLVDPVEDLLV